MALTFNELMQKYVNMDYEELKNVAQRALVEVMPACQKVDPEHKGVVMCSSLILSAIGADGVLTALEKRFLHDVLGLDDDNISTLLKMYDAKAVELADKFADNMGTEVKAAALVLITCFAAVDEKISREETALIRKIMA